MENNVKFLKEKFDDFNIDNLSNFEVQLRSQSKWVNCKDIDLDEDDINNLYHRSEFRRKPFKQFEIGDWVKATYRDNPVKITEDNICYYDGRQYYAQETSSDIWFPEEGELVINLLDSTDDKIEILRVKEFNKNNMKVLFSEGYLNYNEVEPVLGNSKLKGSK